MTKRKVQERNLSPVIISRLGNSEANASHVCGPSGSLETCKRKTFSDCRRTASAARLIVLVLCVGLAESVRRMNMVVVVSSCLTPSH